MLRDGIRDRLIIGGHGSIQRDRGETTSNCETAEESCWDQTNEECYTLPHRHVINLRESLAILLQICSITRRGCLADNMCFVLNSERSRASVPAYVWWA